MQLVPGTIVDRYRVEAELGRGGMARVYRVRHKTLATLHALKVLTIASEELRERLVREGQLQSRLDHPNIVPVRDVLDLEGGPGLLMDFIDGPSLDRWLVEHTPNDADRERIFAGIVDGVAFAHDLSVIHRDLKPGNVMMELKRGVWTPRVADFGLAKLTEGEEEAAHMTRSGRPMGTPAYMAPEQVRSAKRVDQRADIFALGCILYELWCGKRAFVGEDTLEVFNRVANGQFLPPRELVRGLPERVEAAIYGALTVRLDERIPDCVTLRAVLAGERAWALPDRAGATMDGSGFSDELLRTIGGRATISPPSGPSVPSDATWGGAPGEDGDEDALFSTAGRTAAPPPSEPGLLSRTSGPQTAAPGAFADAASLPGVSGGVSGTVAPYGGGVASSGGVPGGGSSPGIEAHADGTKSALRAAHPAASAEDPASARRAGGAAGAASSAGGAATSGGGAPFAGGAALTSGGGSFAGGAAQASAGSASVGGTAQAGAGSASVGGAAQAGAGSASPGSASPGSINRAALAFGAAGVVAVAVLLAGGMGFGLGWLQNPGGSAAPLGTPAEDAANAVPAGAPLAAHDPADAGAAPGAAGSDGRMTAGDPPPNAASGPTGTDGAPGRMTTPPGSGAPPSGSGAAVAKAPSTPRTSGAGAAAPAERPPTPKGDPAPGATTGTNAASGAGSSAYSAPTGTGPAKVSLSADSARITLRGAGGTKYGLGDVPAGSYVIEAIFPGNPAVHAGNLVLSPGQRVVLVCDAAALSCAPS